MVPGQIFCYEAISSAGIVMILPGYTMCRFFLTSDINTLTRHFVVTALLELFEDSKVPGVGAPCRHFGLYHLLLCWTLHGIFILFRCRPCGSNDQKSGPGTRRRSHQCSEHQRQLYSGGQPIVQRVHFRHLYLHQRYPYPGGIGAFHSGMLSQHVMAMVSTGVPLVGSIHSCADIQHIHHVNQQPTIPNRSDGSDSYC